jgi:hypothetical protein
MIVIPDAAIAGIRGSLIFRNTLDRQRSRLGVALLLGRDDRF